MPAWNSKEEVMNVFNILMARYDRPRVGSRSGAIVPLAWSDISGLDRYSGRRGHANSGAGIGFLVGAVADVISRKGAGPLTDQGVVLLLPVAGAVSGALIGVSLFAKTGGKLFPPKRSGTIRRPVSLDAPISKVRHSSGGLSRFRPQLRT